MKIQVALLACFFFLTVSCNEDKNLKTVCGVENPAEELDWLAAEIQAMANSGNAQFLYVSQAKFGTRTVFVFGSCCTNCSFIKPAYTCSGTHIGNIGNGEGDIHPSYIHNEVIIWKLDNSPCYLQ